MANLLEQYEALGRDQGTGPSGQLFKWHFPSSTEYGAATGAVPGLFKSTDAGPMSDEAMAKATELNRQIAILCVDYPVLVPEGEDGPADKDWLPIGKVKVIDLNWLVPRILNGTKLDSKEADTQRRAL